MGISPVIQDLEAKDKQFHVYLSQVRSELSAQANDMNRHIADQAARWKAGNANAKLLASGTNIDLQDSAFSPDSLQGPIKTIVNAALTGAPAPAGVTVERPVQQDVTKKLASAPTGVSDPESFVFGKAVDTISNIIHGFGNPSGPTFNNSVVSQALGLGLHMFLGVSTRMLAATGLSDNRNIYAYAFTYQVYYSE